MAPFMMIFVMVSANLVDQKLVCFVQMVVHLVEQIYQLVVMVGKMVAGVVYRCSLVVVQVVACQCECRLYF